MELNYKYSTFFSWFEKSSTSLLLRRILFLHHHSIISCRWKNIIIPSISFIWKIVGVDLAVNGLFCFVQKICINKSHKRKKRIIEVSGWREKGNWSFIRGQTAALNTNKFADTSHFTSPISINLLFFQIFVIVAVYTLPSLRMTVGDVPDNEKTFDYSE